MARDFEREWRTGYWDYMRGLSHVSRYGVLSSTALHGREKPRVLDVGCGEGELFEHLGGRSGAYTGFDISESAIARARERHPAAKFEVASVETFQSEEKFDVIVFNAILYLFRDKLAVVRRYANMLSPGGALIVENHTTFRDARKYLAQLGELQDKGGWSRLVEKVPLDWLGGLMREYRHQAHYTLFNWSVGNNEFPCRHVHVFGLRARVQPADTPQEREYARSLVDGERGGFKAESPPYLFGTEQMHGALPPLKARGKSVLTIAGSGDQLLNFWWAGAREVTGFDIARNACYVTELKLAALQALERDPFIQAFLDLQGGKPEREILRPLVPKLSPSAQRWLLEVLDSPPSVSKFTVRIKSRATLEKINPYLASDEAFRQTRANARESLLVNADLFRIPERFSARFDLVYLANVLDFNRASAASMVAKLWPVAEAIVSYEFASHPRVEGEYGDFASARTEFDGPVYGGRDSVVVLRNEPSPKPDFSDPEQDALERLPAPLEIAKFGKGGQSSHLYRAQIDGKLYILRAPFQHTSVDVEASLRSHRLCRALARRLGAPELVLPTALIDTPPSLSAEVPFAKMLVMPMLDPSFQPGYAVPASVLAKVPEETRLAAARVAALTQQSDAVVKNAMIDPDGRLALIDLDTCLGRRVWYGAASRSCFLPGGPLAFSSEGEQPQLVKDLAITSPAQAERQFGLRPLEAKSLILAAQAIDALGLAEAVPQTKQRPKDLVFLSAQTDHRYYHWQVEVMIRNFLDRGVREDQLEVLFIYNRSISEGVRALGKAHPGVRFHFYRNTLRDNGGYASLIRPHILARHFDTHPELGSVPIFYHDCDIVFRALPDFARLVQGDTCYVSDTVSYIGAKYIRSKSEEILERMAAIVGIDKQVAIDNEANSGGAQYVLKKIDGDFWRKVERDCLAMYRYFSDREKEERKSLSPAQLERYNPIQKWCADMWSLLWNLWARGLATRVEKELSFSWPTSSAAEYEKHNIFHNAGVTERLRKTHFYKADFMQRDPFDADLSFVGRETGSWHYVQWIQRAAELRRLAAGPP